MSTRVWFDGPRERFWQVPADVEIPPGATTLRSLTGGSVQADVDAIEVYRLEREAARRAVREELRDAANHAGRALGAAAQDVWLQASGALPERSWEDLEARLGPMHTWIDADVLQDRWREGREQVERTTRQARATLQRAGRVASSAVKSARAVSKVVMDNPDLAEKASRWAEVLSSNSPRDGRRAPGEDAPRRRGRRDADED